MWRGNIVKIHIHSSNKISSPFVQELLHSRFYLLSYKTKRNQQNNHIKNLREKLTTAYLKITTIIQYIIILFRLILYITYVHIRPICFLKNLLKKKVGEPGRRKGEDDDKKVHITDSGVPPCRILSSVHVSGTSPQLPPRASSLSNEFTCAMEQGRWVFGANVPSLLSFPPSHPDPRTDKQLIKRTTKNNRRRTKQSSPTPRHTFKYKAIKQKEERTKRGGKRSSG